MSDAVIMGIVTAITTIALALISAMARRPGVGSTVRVTGKSAAVTAEKAN